MKDKRQRYTIFPYQVYGDPMLAASLLAGMSYGYPPNMLPQMPLIAPSMQQAAMAAAAAATTPGPYSNYSGYRYAPYGVPSRTGAAANGGAAAAVNGMINPAHQAAAAAAAAAYPLNIPHGYSAPMGMPVKDEHQHGMASPLSTLSLSPTGSDKLASPIKSDIHNGLLMTTGGASANGHDSRPYHSTTTLEQTAVVKAEKPKLFKPYKSE